MFQNYLLVFLGGGLGAGLRYWLSAVIPRHLGSDFPYGILMINIAGSFLIGVLMSSSEERFLADPSLRAFLIIGILGGFTTFSTFSYETLALLRDAEYLFAGLYVGGTVILGLVATYVGFIIGKSI